MSNPSSPTPAPAPLLSGTGAMSGSIGADDTTPTARSPITSPGKKFLACSQLYQLDSFKSSSWCTVYGFLTVHTSSIFESDPQIMTSSLSAPASTPTTANESSNEKGMYYM